MAKLFSSCRLELPCLQLSPAERQVPVSFHPQDGLSAWTHSHGVRSSRRCYSVLPARVQIGNHVPISPLTDDSSLYWRLCVTWGGQGAGKFGTSVAWAPAPHMGPAVSSLWAASADCCQPAHPSSGGRVGGVPRPLLCRPTSAFETPTFSLPLPAWGHAD